MPQFQKISSAALQLPSQLGGGHTLGETPEDEDQQRGTILGPLKHGPGPGIEDPPARQAAIIEDRFPVVPMDDKPLMSPTARTLQSLGVDEVEEEAIAGVLIHEGLDRKVHGSVSSNMPTLGEILLE
jgi:hypothetical protein